MSLMSEANVFDFQISLYLSLPAKLYNPMRAYLKRVNAVYFDLPIFGILSVVQKFLDSG